jgi:hypothetical protein
VDQQDVGTVVGTVRRFLSNEQLGELTGCIVVVRGHLVRVPARMMDCKAARSHLRARLKTIPALTLASK